MVQLVVNGTKVETQADPGMPLLWFLRDTCRTRCSLLPTRSSSNRVLFLLHRS